MRTGIWKPFFYRLPLRILIWNIRLQQREKFGRVRLSRLLYKRRNGKPLPVKNALSRARRMTSWGQLFDPTLPF